MSRSPIAVKALVASELQAISEPDALAFLRTLLVEPTLERFEWEYGALGETRPCFVVARDEEGGTALLYCEDGFGPGELWGFVRLADRSMGMDSQWFSRLYDAAIGAGLAIAPPGYEVP